jgi:hypothetical protein
VKTRGEGKVSCGTLTVFDAPMTSFALWFSQALGLGSSYTGQISTHFSEAFCPCIMRSARLGVIFFTDALSLQPSVFT